MFHTDDAMFLSKAVTSMPAQYRLEAQGLWQTIGQWCAHEATEGYCTVDQVHQLSPLGKRRTDLLIGLLVDVAGLWERVKWRHQDAILFRDWDVWQDTAEQTKARRDAWRDRKRRQREVAKNERKSAENVAKTPQKSRENLPKNRRNESTPSYELQEYENVPRDTGRDRRDMSRPPLSLNPLHNSHVTSAAYVSNAREPARRSPDGSRIAGDLVAQRINGHHPEAVKAVLRITANELITAGTPVDVVDDALALWLEKPHLGPRALPLLVSEVLKLRDNQPRSRSPANKAQATLEAGARLLENYPDQPGIEPPK